MPPSFEPLLLWIAAQTIVLAALIAGRNPDRPNAWALTSFALSCLAYFAFKLGYLPLGGSHTRPLLAPVLASESLAASLLALYAASTLYRLPSFAYAVLATPPIVEACARWVIMALGGVELAASLAPVWVLYGQVFILLASIGTLMLLAHHFRVYENESADNKRLAVYLLVAPSTVIMAMNFVWFLRDFMTDSPGVAPSVGALLIALSIIVQAWLLTFLIAGSKTAHRLRFTRAGQRGWTAPSEPHRPDKVQSREAQDFERAHEALQQDQLFLDPDLSLDRLARHIGINRSRLSAAINAGANSNFSHWVNTMRVDHAKHLLAATERSVTEIVFDSGFNAKSTFNRVFKTFTGSTPRNWRQQAQPPRNQPAEALGPEL